MKKETRETVLAVSVLFCLLIQVACQPCDGPCHCPWPVSTCPPGVSLVLDGCRCCQMCARQEGQHCSERNVCDGQRGLQCDYSASFPGESGECVRQNLLGCELNGQRYEEGQSFRPTCGQLCQCVGGGITCIPLCTENLNLPITGCSNPRLVQVPGQCCREWVCDSTENGVLLENISADPVTGSWQDAPASGGLPRSNCIEQSMEWSSCSRSCGPGVSTRVSNRNWACRPQTQTRLCQVRPCHPALSAPTSRVQPVKLGTGVCESSYRSPRPVRLEHRGCYSTHSHRPLYCGTCSDLRCCGPRRTATVRVGFRCPWGGMVHHNVMLIQSCICHHNCPHHPLAEFKRVKSRL